jgi:predicted branched-subunit amino acid permease
MTGHSTPDDRRDARGLHRHRLRLLKEGALGTAPLMLGLIPWGIVAGAAMISSGMTPAQAAAMSLLIYAGSVQLAVLPLLVAKAPLWVMLVTALVVNLRYVIYSATLAPHFSHLSGGWRALLSYLSTDGIFAVYLARYERAGGDPERHWYFLGGAAALWVGWQICSWIGIFGGTLIPQAWSLEFAATLGLSALVVMLMFDRAVLVGALAAGAVALFAPKLPLNLGLLAATLVGVVVGMAVARFLPTKEPT